MTDPQTTFQRVPIRPMDCLSESWNLLAGQYWVFFAICLVGMLIQSFVPMNILTGPMLCGIFIAWFVMMKGETITFDLLFKGFDYFGASLIASLILVAVVLVVMIPCYVLLFAGIALGAAAGQETPEIMGIAVLLSSGLFLLVIMTVMTVIMTLFIFVYQLIVDRKLKAIPAMKTSAAAAWANLGGVLGLLGLTSLIATVASFFCIIPIFFIAPWCIGAVGIAYRRVFPEIPDEAPVLAD
ncbi:MAG: hypothetical protein DRJ65_10615 [Acidobacteria bacterium]|nr:MAG: hypothetical protein DRJ65_10615 [Acidobacteriota bacterium]